MGVKKILILCPHLSEKGGVADYYRLVREYFTSGGIHLEYFYTGSNGPCRSLAGKILRTVRDGVALAAKLRNTDLVVLNPSLDVKALVRDAFFHAIAKRLCGKKTVVFFHGWDCRLEQVIDRSVRRAFRLLFNFDRAIVLARQFRATLIVWGYAPEQVVLETTAYEQQAESSENDPRNIVYLARFVPGKGCMEALQTIDLLRAEFPDIRLYMAGDGELTKELQAYVVDRDLGGQVTFTGWLDGQEKACLLRSCGIMLYPTDYGEGMPLCLLEGMGMGLAVITRPVAGIADIMEDGVTGFLVSTLEPADFAEKVSSLLTDRPMWKKISAYNRSQAIKKFEIRSVVKRIEQLYLETAR